MQLEWRMPLWHATSGWKTIKTNQFLPNWSEDIYVPSYKDCYSCRNWDLLVRVLTLWELTKSFIAQHTSKNIHLFLSKAEFEYLKDQMMPNVEVYIKHGVSTNIQPRKCTAWESIKQWVEKEYLRVGTVLKFQKLQPVLGSVILIGLCARPPCVPSLWVGTSPNGALFWLAKMTQWISFSHFPVSHLMEWVIKPIIIAVLTLCTILAQSQRAVSCFIFEGTTCQTRGQTSLKARAFFKQQWQQWWWWWWDWFCGRYAPWQWLYSLPCLKSAHEWDSCFSCGHSIGEDHNVTWLSVLSKYLT
jgi:hypothetical protein